VAQEKFIIISGATASGKTSTSIKVAKYLQEQHSRHAEIINFDSLLFYKELNIGTAKPDMRERDGVKHHLIDVSSIEKPINASDFLALAKPIFESLQKNDIIPILVGGSAFYIRALVKGMINSRENLSTGQKFPQTELLSKLKGDLDSINKYLEDNDPDIFNYFHPNDEYRLTRALEYHLQNDSKYSEEISRINKNRPYDFNYNCQLNGEMLHLYLEVEKSTHLEVMKKRVLQMLENGLIDEVENILLQNFNKNLKPLGSIGYKETIKFIENKPHSIVNELVEEIFISTRQLAKSQKTFFRKIEPKYQISPLTDNHILFNHIDNFILK